MSVPYACPVCSGRGFVPPGYYAALVAISFRPSQGHSGSSIADETCRSCDGRGVLWATPEPREEPSPERLREWAKGIERLGLPTGTQGTQRCACSWLHALADALERQEGEDDGE